MSLIICPECKKEISDTAKTCPHCGYNIDKYLRNAANKKDGNSSGNKNILLIIVVLIFAISLFFLIKPKHEWKDASCTSPKTCTICNETRGKTLQHKFSKATCTEAQICERCGKKQGNSLGHKLGDFTIITEPTCSVVGRKETMCSVCNEVVSKTISTIPHIAGEWTVVEEPTFAKDGENVQYCIVCNQKVKTERTSLPENEKERLFKEACETFAYSDYARDPDDVKGDYCKSYGEVSQVFVSDDGKVLNLRINITRRGTSRVEVWSDDIWVVYTKPEGGKNVLEGDKLTFYGTANGMYSYETVSGATRTVPLVYASYVDIGQNNTSTTPEPNQLDLIYSEMIKDESSGSSGFAFSADVFCQEENGLHVKFVGVDDPAGRLTENYVGIKFMVTNNNSSKVLLLVKGLAINDCSFQNSNGAAEIPAGAKAFLTCTISKDKLGEYGITSIDKLSCYIWISGIGNTNTFTINTR